MANGAEATAILFLRVCQLALFTPFKSWKRKLLRYLHTADGRIQIYHPLAGISQYALDQSWIYSWKAFTFCAGRSSQLVFGLGFSSTERHNSCRPVVFLSGKTIRECVCRVVECDLITGGHWRHTWRRMLTSGENMFVTVDFDNSLLLILASALVKC